MEYYSKEIRKIINKILNETRKNLFFLNSKPNYEYEILNQSLKMTENEKFTSMLKKLGLLDEYTEKYTNVIKNFIYIQSYSDFYRIGRFKNFIEAENSSFVKIDYDKISYLFDDPDVYVEMIKSVEEFSNLSAYDKILITKMLTKKEHNKLKEMNPFYEYEKNMFDIKVNKEFILRQIDNWNKNFDLETSMNATADFILKLNDLNNKNVEILFNEINFNYDENLDNKEKIKEILEKEYSNKQKIKK